MGKGWDELKRGASGGDKFHASFRRKPESRETSMEIGFAEAKLRLRAGRRRSDGVRLWLIDRPRQKRSRPEGRLPFDESFGL
jgi:hypothetical protein